MRVHLRVLSPPSLRSTQVCAVSGVTMCFGGILRDLICKRDVSLGSQGFAFATSSGAIVYVALREAYLRGAPLTLGVRALLSGGVVGVA